MLKRFIFLIIAISSSFVQAEDKEKHKVGVVVGAASVDNVNLGTNISLGTKEIYWGYDLNDTWTLEAGYMESDSKELNIFIESIVFDTDYKVSAFLLDLQARYPLNKKHELFATLGVNFYDQELTGEQTFSESGTGSNLGFGWQVKFDNNIGLKAEYSFMYLEDVDFSGFNVGISYHF